MSGRSSVIVFVTGWLLLAFVALPAPAAGIPAPGYPDSIISLHDLQVISDALHSANLPGLVVFPKEQDAGRKIPPADTVSPGDMTDPSRR